MRMQNLVRRAVITSVAVVLLLSVGESAIAQKCPPGAYEVSRTETATEIEIICDCLQGFKLISGVCKKIVRPPPRLPKGTIREAQRLQAAARLWYWYDALGLWINRTPESCRRACSGGIYHDTAGVWIKRTPERDAERCRRACMDGIDVPPPAFKREETLRDWMHRKWGEAQVKGRAWWNDPMHQEWVSDAYTIATLPFWMTPSVSIFGARGAPKRLAKTTRHVYVNADQISDFTPGRDIWRLNADLLSRPGSKTIFHIKHSDGAVTTFEHVVSPRGSNFLKSIYDAGPGAPRRVLSVD